MARLLANPPDAWLYPTFTGTSVMVSEDVDHLHGHGVAAGLDVGEWR
ncbi:MAG: hypothetical protein ACRED0_04305 [Gammaproteobacteria bacterium]